LVAILAARLFNGGRARRKVYVRAADQAELPVSASVVCQRVAMARWKTSALKSKPKVATQRAEPDRKAEQ